MTVLKLWEEQKKTKVENNIGDRSTTKIIF